MTKRVLSLLLTLVMVLSLCVPAIAADGEFVAEAPADVVEEAPAAPVEPEAPEAEEPAEEPVVDEPVVEEADAPEIAAVMEEEDLPYLVALGTVEKLTHWKLESAIEAAKPYKARVDAGELYIADDTDYENTSAVGKYEDGDAATRFNKAYAKALEYDAAIHDGSIVNNDVTEYSVNAMAQELADMFPSDGSDDWTTAKNNTSSGSHQGSYLTDVVPTSVKNNFIAADINKNVYPDEHYTYYEENGVAYRVDNTYATGYADKYGVAKSQAAYTLDNTQPDEFFSAKDKTPWEKLYKADYITALKAAVKAAHDFNLAVAAGTAKYKDYVSVVNLIKAAEAVEQAAGLPSLSDASNLQKLIDQVEDVQALPADDKLAYVDPDGEATSPAQGLLEGVKGLNGFETTVRYYDYVRAVDDMNKDLTKVAATAKILDYEIASMNKVTFSIGIPDTGNDNDGTKYAYGYTVNNLYAEADSTNTDFTGNASKGLDNATNTLKKNLIPLGADTVTKFDPTQVDDGYMYYSADIEVDQNIPDKLPAASPVGAGVAFDPSDRIVLHLYQEVTISGKTTWREVDNQLVVMPADGYAGPAISDKTGAISVDHGVINGSQQVAQFNYKRGDLTKPATTISDTPGGDYYSGVNVTIKVKTDKDFTPDFTTYMRQLALVGANGKDILKIGDSDITTSNNPGISYQVTSDTAESKITAGTLNLKLRVAVSGLQKDLAVHEPGGSGKITFESITKWGGIAGVKNLIADIDALIKTDYVYKSNATSHVTVHNVDEAWQVLTNDRNLLQAYVNGGTYANTHYNRHAIIELASHILDVYGFLDEKELDLQALQDMIIEAEALKPDDYTYDSFGKMNDALVDAKKTLATATLQSEIDKALGELTAAKNALLKEGEVDKSALKGAIEKAQALKEADYTPESWAANKDAIDAAIKAAQNVVDDALATQAQVTGALNTLNGAIDKLVSVDAGDDIKPPASGTGWRYVPETGDYYFFKNGQMVHNYWVGKVDGASAWDGNWYYVGADGKMATGMQYLDDLHGGFGWYYLQPTDKNGEIGKMLTGWQTVGGQYGTCWFSNKSGSSGKCTYSSELGDWNGTTWTK